MRHRMIAYLLPAGMTLLASALPAQACSILDPHGPAHTFNSSEIVLLAQPVSTTRAPIPDNRWRWPHDYQQHVVWEVVKAWKGPIRPGERFEEKNLIRGTGSDCTGYNIVEEGQRVVFYSRHPPQLSRYYHVTEETVGLLFDALANGAINP